MKRFKDKVVIVTGASSGIGLACAIRLAECGAKVVFAARSSEKISSRLASLRERGYTAEFVETDVRKEDECEFLCEKTIEYFGRIDMLINNAGISMRAVFSQTYQSVLKDVMDTNFWGSVYCTRYALPQLLRNKGVLVSVSSVSGKAPLPARTGYCASKYALEGFIESLRIENLNSGMHVMVVRPGFTKTEIRKKALNNLGLPQEESPRDEESMMSAEEVAERVLMGVIKRKREFTLTAQGKVAVFFYKLFPSLLDKIIFKTIAKEPGSPFCSSSSIQKLGEQSSLFPEPLRDPG